jgi:hypothetical protein
MKESSWTSIAPLNAVVLAALLAASSVSAETPPVPDKFTMTTTSMTPSDVGLRVDVRSWSDEAARAAVVAALAQEADVRDTLASLPSVGVVWQSGSAVGYAVKYAHRASTPEGERITFVTDRVLGSYDFKPWAANPPAARALDYSVIELYLDGNGRGSGSLSLAAEVKLDSAGGLVSLEAAGGAPRVLKDAKLEPKPYWATGG